MHILLLLTLPDLEDRGRTPREHCFLAMKRKNNKLLMRAY